MFKNLVKLCCLTTMLAFHSSLGSASTYPARPIKVIVPFPPGGLFDTIGRPLAEKLKAHLGTVIIENIGGAGSSRGAAVAARAEPDGYTLILGGNGSHVIMPLASSSLSYDPIKNFEPISLIGTAPLAIAVHPKQTFQTMGELIAAANRDTSKLTFGIAGLGSTTHLTGEMFKQRAPAPDIVYLPYTGGGPLVNDLVAGHIPVSIINMTSQFSEFHATGKIKILVVTSPARIPSLPDIPTAAETLPGMISQNFGGLFAPKGTPIEIINQIASAMSKTLKDPDLRRIYEAGGFDVSSDQSPEALRQFLGDELVRWKPIIDASGFKAN